MRVPEYLTSRRRWWGVTTLVLLGSLVCTVLPCGGGITPVIETDSGWVGVQMEATIATSALMDVEELRYPPFTARVNPTGTHIKDGRLKIRIDLYPSEGSKCYETYNVTVAKYTEEELKANPELKQEYTQQLNPCLCHFIVIDEKTKATEVEAYVKAIFDTSTIVLLDDLFAEPVLDGKLLNGVMRDRTLIDTSTTLVDAEKEQEVVDDTNSKLMDNQVSVGDVLAQS